MAIESIASVKSKFETGDTPSQADFVDFIDTVGRGSMLAVASGVEGGGVGVVSFTTAATVEFNLIASAGATILGIESISSVKSLLDVPTSGVGAGDNTTFTGSNTFQGPTAFTSAISVSATAQITFVQADTVSASSVFVQGQSIAPVTYSAIASATGTTSDITGIPANATTIHVYLKGFSTNGVSEAILQLGTGSGFETTGYQSTATEPNVQNVIAATSGFILVANQIAAETWSGVLILSLMDATTNTWMITGGLTESVNTGISISEGRKDLGGTLTQARLTTINGTDSLDAGSWRLRFS